MSKQILFFATKSDLEHGLSSIGRPLLYVKAELYKSPEYKSFTSLLDWPDLGKNTAGDYARSDQFLILDRSAEVQVEAVPQRKGGIHYFIEPTLNPVSIVFQPGGLYQEQCLIAGSVGTASSDSASISLYQEFRKKLIKGFKKIGNYYVGPEALSLMDQGMRLVTMGIDEPPEYDLKQ